MDEIKKYIEYCHKNKKQILCVAATTVMGLCVGAYFGIQAFYNGWLG